MPKRRSAAEPRHASARVPMPRAGSTSQPVSVLTQMIVETINARPTIASATRVALSVREAMISSDPAIAGHSGPLAAISAPVRAEASAARIDCATPEPSGKISRRSNDAPVSMAARPWPIS